MIGILFTLVAITLLVAAHEAAHLFTGIALGARARTYAVGFGPIIKKRTVAGISVQVRAIPLGGFVSFVGELTDEGPGSLSRLARWRQVATIVAGPVSNLVLGLGLTILGMALLGRTDAVSAGVTFYGGAIDATTGALGQVALGNTSEIGGLPTIAVSANDVFGDLSLAGLVLFAGLISLSLGMMNLLPIPPLDGGHALVAALRLGFRARVAVSIVGMTAVLLFAVFINGRDIVRLFF